jgi:hypothetical protein
MGRTSEAIRYTALYPQWPLEEKSPLTPSLVSPAQASAHWYAEESSYRVNLYWVKPTLAADVGSTSASAVS